MIGPNLAHPSMAEAENAQLRKQNMVLLDRAETFGRALILILESIETGTEGALLRVDGKVAVRLDAMKSVAERRRISARIGRLEPKNDPTLKPEDVVVFEVSDREPPSKLIVPNGVVK